MSSDEETGSSSSPEEVRVLEKVYRKRKKQKDRKPAKRPGARTSAQKAPPKSRKASSKSSERKRGRSSDKKKKTKKSEEGGDLEEESTIEMSSTSFEENVKDTSGEPVPKKKRLKAPKEHSSEYEEVFTSIPSKDLSSKEIYALLRQQDSKFAGILSDFTIPLHKVNALLEGDPGLSSKFEEAAPVEDAEQELVAAATTIQSAIHYLMRALGKLAKEPATARKYLTSSLSLTLHGFGRLHSSMVGKMVGVTEDMKQLVALKKHTGRDMRDVIDDAFFRTGGGSLALSAAPTASLAPSPTAFSAAGATRTIPMGNVPFPKPHPAAFSFAAAPQGAFPLPPPRQPPPPFTYASPRFRQALSRPRLGGPPRPRTHSYSPPRAGTLGARPRSPQRRH
jgi:hypothetical protein